MGSKLCISFLPNKEKVTGDLNNEFRLSATAAAAADDDDALHLMQ
jgi:hypothetical protein